MGLEPPHVRWAQEGREYTLPSRAPLLRTETEEVEGFTHGA